jgi:hypothetical protein
MLTCLRNPPQRTNGDKMSAIYEKIEKLELTLQTLREHLLEMRKTLIGIKREYSSENELEGLVSEATKLINKGENMDPTTMIREMRDGNCDW